jgi:DNA-binding PadR family transcriptional regulator
MFRKHGMFHGPWREGPFQKGDLKYVILDLIKDKPRHGYEVIRILEERSHGLYAPSPGAVYPTLQLLEEMGYVSSAEQDGKKVYSITEEGRHFLSERGDFAEGIKKHLKEWWGGGDPGDIRDTVAEYGKIGQMLARRFRGLDAEKMRRVREVLSRAYTEIEGIVQE